MDCRQRVIGKSVEGRPIVAWEFGESGRSAARSRAGSIVVFGGFHGDEPKSVRLVENLRELLGEEVLPVEARRWILVPCVNPDGAMRRTRRNARKVDLNRNFPTRNWSIGNPRSRMYGGPRPASEPETRAIIRLLESCSPGVIVTVHSIDRNRFCNNYDGPGRSIAQKLSRYNRYPVTATIGYPTPGSFGNWAGVERGIPTITLELPSHHSAKRGWEDNRGALLSVGS